MRVRPESRQQTAHSVSSRPNSARVSASHAKKKRQVSAIPGIITVRLVDIFGFKLLHE